MTTYHLRGKVFCGFSRDNPCHWPMGHEILKNSDPKESLCLDCKAIFERVYPEGPPLPLSGPWRSGYLNSQVVQVDFSHRIRRETFEDDFVRVCDHELNTYLIPNGILEIFFRFKPEKEDVPVNNWLVAHLDLDGRRLEVERGQYLYAALLQGCRNQKIHPWYLDSFDLSVQDLDAEPTDPPAYAPSFVGPV